MPSSTKDDVSSSAAAGPAPAGALQWAADNFGFDPGNRTERQRGVGDLQSWLDKNGAKVAADAILGPATLAALERVFAAGQAESAKGRKTAKARKAAKGPARAAGKTGAEEGAEEDEPGTTPEPGDDGYDARQHGEEQDSAQPSPPEDAASARPVALSDSAIEDISQDRLGFTPYVEAVAEFILAEQTRPPLAIAINARWGQGKTSFMNMLEGQLKSKSRETTTRVATTWFNPWKYSEPEQVWAAFVANVTRCVRANLTREQTWRFKWDRFVVKLRRHADVALALRLAVALVFVLLVLTLPFTLDLAAFLKALQGDNGLLGAIYEGTKKLDGLLLALLFIPLALLSVLYGYITFSKNLGLNLLEYVEKTDFKDKIGTLSQFESEMRRLADAVPEDLKIVVFIDDLDRCKGKVLGEIIEALQLADVSRTCIFVLGMDMHIVAHAIEKERQELAQTVGGSTSMEHGSGYKFLEKIIQARLALPTHGQAEMAGLVASAMGRQPAAPGGGGPAAAAGTAGPGAPPKHDGLIQNTLDAFAGRDRGPRETPSDSQAVIETAEHYGSRHFTNPRRLKRFINGFRLQAYLASALRPETAEVDRLARFLVLAEKWPALVHYMVEKTMGADVLEEARPKGTLITMGMEIRSLRDEDRTRVIELLTGRGGADPLSAEDVGNLAAWYGFDYYRGVEMKR